MIAATQKKLREARFFLGFLRRRDRVTPPEREEFEFYLSAFLSAARSVTFALENEEAAKYKEWRGTAVPPPTTDALIARLLAAGPKYGIEFV